MLLHGGNPARDSVNSCFNCHVNQGLNSVILKSVSYKIDFSGFIYNYLFLMILIFFNP